MKNQLIICLFILSFISTYAKRFQVEFTNTQSSTCVVYLDKIFIGKIENEETFSTKLKKGIHNLSFVVFQSNGSYYTYLRELEVETASSFLLVINDSGDIHLEKYEGINPLVLAAIQHLPILTTDAFNLLLLKLENVSFENYSYELIRRTLVNYRFSTAKLQTVISYLHTKELVFDVIQFAYQHLVDKQNYQQLTHQLDESPDKKLEGNVFSVNQFL